MKLVFFIIYIRFYNHFYLLRSCSFLEKVILAEKAGAVAALVFDNDSQNEFLIDMIHDGTGKITSIPCGFLSYIDGIMIKQALEKHISALLNIPLNLTFINQRNLRRAPWSYF